MNFFGRVGGGGSRCYGLGRFWVCGGYWDFYFFGIESLG